MQCLISNVPLSVEKETVILACNHVKLLKTNIESYDAFLTSDRLTVRVIPSVIHCGSNLSNL